jgi:hypothetical protein
MSNPMNTINADVDYHPETASIYPANFDSSGFEGNKMREFNRLNEDLCYNQRKTNDNNKKLKFMTTNHKDLLEANDKLNFFGMSSRNELFVPGDKIDTYSNLLNGENGGTLTNCNVRNGFGQLPVPTTPYKGQLQHGDVVIEDSIRELLEVKKNACLPKESNFEQRSFTIFNNDLDIETPNPIMSVETSTKGFNFGRNGESTRFSNRYTSKINRENTYLDAKRFFASNEHVYK